MTSTALSFLFATVSGGLVGLILGLLGGGGSILAVPLMVYFVGVRDPHVAIGTSALVVAANAAVGVVNHWRAGNVKWRCATLFAIAGIVGAAIGSTFGKAMDGQRLLFLFAIVMIVIGILMLRRRTEQGDPAVRLGKENAAQLIAYGAGAGLFSGFFGIGGGFLIVPGLIAATGMPMLNAIGSSLVAVTAFGVTTAANYAVSGLVDWPIAALFIAGGVVGSFAGTGLGKHFSKRKGTLNRLFAGLVFIVAGYMIWRNFG